MKLNYNEFKEGRLCRISVSLIAGPTIAVVCPVAYSAFSSGWYAVHNQFNGFSEADILRRYNATRSWKLTGYEQSVVSFCWCDIPVVVALV